MPAKRAAFEPASRTEPNDVLSKVLAFEPKPDTAANEFSSKIGGRPTDAEQGRSRSYLTPDEIERLIAAAKKLGRHGHRDATLILIAYRHGLRVSELVDLRWSDVDLAASRLHVRRVKKGLDGTHPLQGDELRALRRLKREYGGAFAFSSERKGPLTRHAVNKLVARAGQAAGLSFPAHPHQLRHATGFALANRGVATRTIQLYLGHSSIRHTTRYTALAEAAFDRIWR